MSRFDCVIHQQIPAPPGLVAIFVERIFAKEPSLVKAYKEEWEAWKAIRLARTPAGQTPDLMGLDGVGKRPQEKYRERFVTKEMNVVAFGTYDELMYEKEYDRSQKEIGKQRKAGAVVMTRTGEQVPVPFLDEHDPDLVFLGFELNGKPYGTRYHLHARTDLGYQAPFGYTWVDNEDPSNPNPSFYGSSTKLPKMPTLYPMGDSQIPIEPESRLIERWEAEGADIEEHIYVDRRYHEKNQAIERARQAEQFPPISVTLKRYKEALDRELEKKLSSFKAKLEKEKQAEFEQMKAKLEAKEEAAWSRASADAQEEREAQEAKQRNAKLD